MKVSAVYEAALVDLYAAVGKMVADHACAHPGCGDNDRCNPLSNQICELLEETFAPEDAERWLRDCPDAWEWSAADGHETVRDYVADVFQTDAWERLFPNYSILPVHPAITVEHSYT